MVIMDGQAVKARLPNIANLETIVDLKFLINNKRDSQKKVLYLQQVSCNVGHYRIDTFPRTSY
jgi:hypothetical protein